MTPNPHITIIFNPAAGRGRAKHILVPLQKALQQSALDYTFISTSGPGDAVHLARDASKNSSIVVAVGGDGTVNEVASGLIGSDCALAVLSEGSGNDFARIINAPKRPGALIAQLEQPFIKKFDAGSIRVTDIRGQTTERLFFNSVGLGFDAAVARKVNAIRWMRGIPLYLTALFHTIAGYRPHHFTVQNGTAEWKRNYFLLCIGNGRWEGGGFQLTPNAVPDDGLFEVCGVTGDSILKVLPILPLVMTGKHLGKKYIESFDTSALTVQSERGFPVHGDGEIFGWEVQKAEITLIPKSLNVVVSNVK